MIYAFYFFERGLTVQNTILKMTGIKKSYEFVEVLHGVDFELEKAEVHALVGENGAGKSTLMKILGGITKADEGEILIDNSPVEINSIADAERLGISIIHQELSLVPYMTVAENIFLGHMPMKSIFVDDALMDARAREVLDAMGMEQINTWQKCSELTVAQQQMVEIARALLAKTRIIVMDEPTASLTARETERLFEFVERYKREGISIIYISHKMDEIFRITDKITVLRDGNFIGTRKTAEVEYDELVSMMVGREYSTSFPRSNYNGKGEEALKVENLSGGNLFQDINFCVHKGEILGFYGLVGSGRTEVMRAIFGVDKATDGNIYVMGEKINVKKPKDAIKSGIALVPESRKEHGLIVEQTIRFNTMLAILDKFIKGINIDHNFEDSTLNNYINMLSIKLKSVDQAAKNLSGGNQQKVVLAKWLASEPKIIIFDEPTRGIDVGAKHEIYKLITELADKGLAVIFISSELPEIIGLSDNLIVFREGKQSAFLSGDEIQGDTIIKYAMRGISK